MNHEISKNDKINRSDLTTNILTDQEILNEIENLSNYSYAKNTFKSYQSDFKKFTEWCLAKNYSPLPADIKTVTFYITQLYSKNYKVSSIERKIFAISKFHAMDNHILNLKDKNFIATWNGIKRKLGHAQNRKSPLLIGNLRTILAKIDSNFNIGIRDKALISFGWASAMRRSEIVALDWSDIQFIDKAVIVNIKTSKTDQFGKGRQIAIVHGNNKATCPIRTLQAWQSIAINNEAVFTSIHRSDKVSNIRLSDRDVARILKKRLLKADIDESNYAGHSLRSGFITTAAENKKPDHKIMEHSGHKSVQTFLKYKRNVSLIEDNPTSDLGL